MRVFIIPLLLLCTLSSHAQVSTPRTNHLLSELRCLVCQNQDLLDSHAPLALDLKAKVYDLMEAGWTDEQIKTYLVERYGDFILFKPPVAPSTWVLWFAPGFFLLLGLGGLIYWVRRQRVVN